MKMVAEMRSNESEFARDVQIGLSKIPKRISSKYFYDKRGSQLFDLITEQEEYYLTRTEKLILETRLGLLEPLTQGITEVVEFGPGDGSKAKIIVDQMLSWNADGLKYTAVDISPASIQQSLKRMSNTRNLNLDSVIGDYHQFSSPSMNHGRLFLFLGSNIGNYEPDQAVSLLRHFGSLMTSKDVLLIGFDKKNDISTMTAAYNDRAGITRDFNFNLLARMNRELGSDFTIDSFSHHGIYNPLIGAMQSFLISRKNQEIHFESFKRSFSFDLGEAIHVENSYKYSDRDIASLAKSCGFGVAMNLEDNKQLFTDSVWRVKEKI